VRKSLDRAHFDDRPRAVFEPRGTPFSEFHRIRALTASGIRSILVAPFGRDVSLQDSDLPLPAPPFVRVSGSAVIARFRSMRC
jgi:hypothetical protein